MVKIGTSLGTIILERGSNYRLQGGNTSAGLWASSMGEVTRSMLCYVPRYTFGARREAGRVTTNLSATQIDRLGNRLEVSPLADSDLKLLDEYRRSFGEAYEAVIRAIREQLKLAPTGRPAKSTGAIIEKLRRETIRLSQVQDIAGCRVVVANIEEQERVVAALCAAFPQSSVKDRREKPSYGYRAVHVIIEIAGKLIEVQVRTSLQHLWAELSEKLSDVYDPTIKYGGGDDTLRVLLSDQSEMVSEVEGLEKSIAERRKMSTNYLAAIEETKEMEKNIVNLNKQIAEILTDIISLLKK